MATADPLLNQTIGGCEILEVLGQGGMGVIYKARQKSLERVVALKVLARHLASDINFVARFQKEARAIAKVNHPNILAVYDVGEDQNVNYMIMELIDGRSLEALQTERRGAIPWEEATDYIRQAAQGLEAAHATGIIHRDIKPENLMVTRKNVIKVSDFGLAKDADASTGVTSIDAVMGTPAFMSPEQCDGRKLDGRSDIYSLGGSFYRLLTGRLPFEAETAMSMMYRHKHEALIPPHEIVPTVPAALSAVIVKMMAKKREHRYQTASEVIDALDAARKGAAAPAEQPFPSGIIPAPAGMPPMPASAGAPPMAGFGEPLAAAEPAGMPPVEAPARRGTRLLGADDPGSRMPSPSQAREQSGRMPAMQVPMGGFGAASDSSSRLSMPTGVLGIVPQGLTGDEGYGNVARGDEMVGRGDRLGGLRYYRMALQSAALDQATRARVEQELRKEVSQRRQAVDGMLKRGMLVEANRECRVLTELDPADEFARNTLRDLEGKLSLKRTLVNDIRTAIAGSEFEKAIKLWENTPADLRDDALGKQVEQMRTVLLPALNLARQGDNLSQQGRLEEALSSFEDALKIHPGCEQARQGQKDTEQKLQRIEHMLREGFQHSLEQNYDRAIEAWKPILELRPGHPQAVKSIVDACMAQAQRLRARGDLEAAVAAYQGAREVDKQNRAVQRALDELTNLLDKERALVDRAQEAASRNRLSAAISYWKEAQRINPSNKRAAGEIAELSKRRSSVLLKAAIVLVVFSAAGAAGYQYVIEMRALGAAREKIHGHAYAEVPRILMNARVIFNGREKQALLAAAELELQIEEAEKQAAQGKLVEAARELKAIAERVAHSDKGRATQLQSRATELRVRHALALGRQAIRDGRWQDAAGHFADVQTLVQEQKAATPELLNLRGQADMAAAFALDAGLLASLKDNQTQLLNKLKDMLVPATELDKQGFTGALAFVNQELQKRNFDPQAFGRLLGEAKAIVARASLTDEDLAQARGLLDRLAKQDPGSQEVKQLADYLDAVGFCSGQGMGLYARHGPARKGNWGRDERQAAFCVDRYEWPNRAGAAPTGNLTWVEARAECERVGKTLCARRDWEDACKGYEGLRYPYGRDADPAACNTAGTGVLASGAKTGCKNALGLYDMSGNLAEWTDSGLQDVAEVMGGGYDTPVQQASCLDAVQQGQQAKLPSVGFRCCRRLPEPAARP
jgi:tetratricopeptide (TPR) repeat protein/tRNA A-37 threonylcarbamoyl transferase component Bud32